MPSVSMKYSIGDDDDVDVVIDVATKLRDARDMVLDNYKGKAECYVFLPPLETEPHFSVSIDSTERSVLTAALRDYMAAAGSPSYFEPYSDYAAAEEAVSSQGKQLERGWLMKLTGKMPVVEQRKS